MIRFKEQTSFYNLQFYRLWLEPNISNKNSQCLIKDNEILNFWQNISQLRSRQIFNSKNYENVEKNDQKEDNNEKFKMDLLLTLVKSQMRENEFFNENIYRLLLNYTKIFSRR
jgi:hypothetical protein